MKKLFVIFLSFIYLVLSSGFTKYSHTCKAMAVKTYSLTNTGYQKSDEPCPICVSNKKDIDKQEKDCCQHETQIVKVDDSIKKQNNIDFSVKFWGDTIPNELLGAVFDFAVATDENQKSTPYFSSKIPIRGNPLYILHCVYRI